MQYMRPSYQRVRNHTQTLLRKNEKNSLGMCLFSKDFLAQKGKSIHAILIWLFTLLPCQRCLHSDYGVAKVVVGFPNITVIIVSPCLDMQIQCFRSKYQLQEFLQPSLRIVSNHSSESGKHAGNASQSDGSKCEVKLPTNFLHVIPFLIQFQHVK
jgi:hypothetical protein